MTSITSMSSRGQVVIPLDIREMMGLKDGEKFIVSGQQDTIVLKKMKIPSFDEMIQKSRKFAKETGLTQKDVDAAIKRVRREKV
jgi:AbrB family looped-hinge helix DNA binding protein